MPFPSYHFGASTFFGLALRKWIDVPVFVFANIIVDLEVLLYNHESCHRYIHNLLIGAAAGAVWGALAYLAKPIFAKIMRFIRINYKPNLIKMIISGILGIWLHVFIDSIYYYDILVFWPGKAKPFWRLLSKSEVRLWCKLSFIGIAILYILAVHCFNKAKKHGN